MGQEQSDIILIFVSSAIIIAVLAVLVTLFVVIYQKRIVAQDMKLQKFENDFQQELLQATIEGQERERRRLAKDLHDSIGSLLTGLRLNLKYQQRQAEPSSAQMGFLSEACGMLDEGIVEVRRVSHNLMPITLESFGLLQAVEEWIEPLQQADHFSIEMKTIGTPVRPQLPVELGLLRVLQELLQNTIRHAKASKAKIEIEFAADSICLKYFDNGIGMDNNKQPSGIGIKNMQSRISALNGTIQFDDPETTGFCAQISVPTN
jgi:two-component system NarL family sensor kinase